ncbi:hypothetical protein BDV23DRAFT_189454 [Aspergillus alliaceus]|uniref:Uncharacterized protein n=1 Tax=Petromyces alliaceus TaxID=209559 RepID=A0A5N7BQU3_PETAA|nr:hypothetical protein BDV23DRAFT_189454 [Aspergillus alliaceus]
MTDWTGLTTTTTANLATTDLTNVITTTMIDLNLTTMGNWTMAVTDLTDHGQLDYGHGRLDEINMIMATMANWHDRTDEPDQPDYDCRG